MHIPRYRDRHGRGIRGSLLPPSVPAHRTATEIFDSHVLDTVELLERRWPQELSQLQFAVEDVPAIDTYHNDNVLYDGPIPLSRLITNRNSDHQARIVIYRRPLEARTQADISLSELVKNVIIEQLAALWGLLPEDIDP